MDSTRILRHLEERFPHPPILPASPDLRARAHIIEDWADESLFFYDLAMRGWPNNIDWLKRDVLSHDSGALRWLMDKLIPGFVRKTGQAQGIGRKDRDTVCEEVAVHFDAIVDLLARAGRQCHLPRGHVARGPGHYLMSVAGFLAALDEIPRLAFQPQ